jgi:hypothetical protein
MFGASVVDFHASQFDEFLLKAKGIRNERLAFEDNFSVQVEGGDVDDWWPAAYAHIEYDDNGEIIYLSFHHCTFAHLPESLQSLKNLKKLSLNSLEHLTNLDNSILSRLPNLQALELNACFSIQTIPSLPRCMTSLSLDSCHRVTFLPQSLGYAPNLTSLNISNMMLPAMLKIPSCLRSLHISGSQLSVFKLKSSLHGHSNIRTLRLSMCDLDEQDLAMLWSTIPTCKYLRTLNVSGNRIATIDLDSITMGQPTRLRTLNLEANPVVNTVDIRDRIALARILEANQELCCIGCKQMNWPLLAAPSRGLAQALDQNFARILVHERFPVPLSLWPLVIAKTNGQLHKEESRKATIVYNILLGPAFVGRLPYTYSDDV